MNLYLFAAPQAFWDRPEVAAAIAQARDAARRLTKSVEAPRERRRLTAALQAIDEAVRAACPTPRRLAGEEARTVLDALPRVGRARLPFKLLDGPGPFGGFVVAPIAFDPQSTFTRPRPADPARTLPADEAEPSAAGPGGRSRLIREIVAARADGRAVALGRARHGEITLAMRAFLHQEPGQKPFEVRFVYSDGSTSGPVSLAARASRPRPVGEVELAVGLNSCRHFEIDPEIDVYLLRNSELERRDDDRFSDQEQFAYERMETLLGRYRDRVVEIKLYHAGLEPAVIGAYRAILDSLRGGQALVITPIFYPGAPAQEAWW